MRKLVVLLAVLALAAVAAGAAAGRGGPPPPQFPKLAGDWSHAEINVKIRGVPHTLILDRGRIIQVTATGITLRAADGTTPPSIPISDATVITFGRPRLHLRVGPAALRRGLFAETMRIDGGPAVRVRLTLFR
jgi:hypothetical protein